MSVYFIQAGEGGPTPKELDSIVDVVLAYRPKPKTKPARKRQRARRKIAKDANARP